MTVYIYPVLPGTKILEALTLESQVSQKAGGENSNQSLVNILILPVTETPAQGPADVTPPSSDSGSSSSSESSSVDLEAWLSTGIRSSSRV